MQALPGGSASVLETLSSACHRKGNSVTGGGWGQGFGLFVCVRWREEAIRGSILSPHVWGDHDSRLMFVCHTKERESSVIHAIGEQGCGFQRLG
jgi:hypothetical protein